MSHANTTNNFKRIYAQFPCSENKYCELVRKYCSFGKNIEKCKIGKQNSKKIIKIVDSGVFTKDGCMFPSYEDLFRQYEKMNTDYGIIIDYLKDPKKTIKSAKRALKVHKQKRRNFKIIGVAQGNSIKEYLDCYDELKKLGYKHIAVGGLLKKKVNTVRFVQVRNEEFLWSVLSTIRRKHPEDWLFALGCYSPKRHSKFLDLKINGCDYKGWIFQYSKKNETAKRGDLGAKRSRYTQVRNYVKKHVVSKPQKKKDENKLLILSCSKRKKKFCRAQPAIDVYDGVFFRQLKKYVSDFSNSNGFDILILSAKHGFIEPMTSIEFYEQQMSKNVEISFNEQSIKILEKQFTSKNYKKVFINLGKDYRKAIDGFENYLPAECEVEILKQKIGVRMKKSKKWLEENTNNNPSRFK